MNTVVLVSRLAVGMTKEVARILLWKVFAGGEKWIITYAHKLGSMDLIGHQSDWRRVVCETCA